MKKPTVILSLLLTLALAVPAQTQEVFDLLRKGDIAGRQGPGREDRLSSPRSAWRRRLTLLHYAAYGLSADLVDFLIDKGAKPDRRGSNAVTPLHLAAMNDRRTEVAAASSSGAPRSRRGTTTGGRRSCSAPANAARRPPAASSSKPGRTSTPRTSSVPPPSSSRPGAAKPTSSICSSRKGPECRRPASNGQTLSPKPWPTA